jgi:hypothetical protein
MNQIIDIVESFTVNESERQIKSILNWRSPQQPISPEIKKAFTRE